MLKILQAMQKEIQELKSQQPEISSDPSKRKQRQKKRIDISKYCWTHGAWGHINKDCKRKSTGHKYEAIIANGMGGSSFYCTGAE